MSSSTHSDQKRKTSSMSSRVACSEESGWTTYLDDFLQSGSPVESIVDSWDHEGSSLISDAASSAAWQIAKHKYMWLGPEVSDKKLSLKKRRTKGALDDDALEDTASSPVNSPKISDMKHFEETKQIALRRGLLNVHSCRSMREENQVLVRKGLNHAMD